MHNTKQQKKIMYLYKYIDFLSKIQAFENAHRSTPLTLGAEQSKMTLNARKGIGDINFHQQSLYEVQANDFRVAVFF